MTFRTPSNRPLRWAAAALLALALAAGVTPAVVTPHASATSLAGDCTPGADWGTLRADLASQTVQLVNAHRASLGLAALTVSPTLDASAVWKARHMARYGYMAHDDPAPPVARPIGERMQACGVTGGWGENIAYGYTTAQAVLQGWLSSPGHRANIENPNWRAIGSGAATGSGATYWAQTFGTSTDGAPPPPPPPAPPAPGPQPPTPVPQPPAPVPAPPSPAPGATSPSTPAVTSSASGVVLSGLRIAPRRPRAGEALTSSVRAFKSGVRMKKAHVFCSGRLEGRALEVVARRFRNGRATCVWQLPSSARGKLVSGTMVVQQGRLKAQAPFRTRVAS